MEWVALESLWTSGNGGKGFFHKVYRLPLSESFALIRIHWSHTNKVEYVFDTGEMRADRDTSQYEPVYIDIGEDLGRGKGEVVRNALKMAKELRQAADLLEQIVSTDNL